MQLQDHVTCTLVDAIEKHLGPTAIEALAKRGKNKATDPEYQLWQKIVDYNIQDSVNLTLAVTQSQGLNPSFSFITPLTGLGHSVEKIIDTSNGLNTVSNATNNTFNRSLSIGFGLNGTQVHNIVLTYTLDLHKIYDAMYEVGTDGTPAQRPDGAKKWCDEIRAAKSPTGIPYGLKGDLALVETLETGLQLMDRGFYSPAIATSGSPPAVSQSGSFASVSQAAGATGFSSKVDFTLGWGVNGGPNWALLKRKGPAGGNSQPINYTRSKQDTLISTFSATCHGDRNINLKDGHYFFDPVLTPRPGAVDGSTRAFELRAYLRRQPDLTTRPDNPNPLPYPEGSDDYYNAVAKVIIMDLVLGKDESKLPFTYSGNGTGAMTVVENPTPENKNNARKPNMNGTITASSFATDSKTSFSYSVRGAIADGLSGAFVGNMHTGVTVTSPTGGTVNNLDISQNALRLLIEQTGVKPHDEPTRNIIGEAPRAFWASLPSCSTAAPFLLNNQTILQRLPREVSDTLQQ